MCPKCEELAAEMRRRLAVNRAVGDQLDDLLGILEEPDPDDQVDLMEKNLEQMRRNTPAAVEADQPIIVEADDEEDDDPQEPTPLDDDVAMGFAAPKPSVNGQAKRATAPVEADPIQVLAEKCPGIIRMTKDGRLAHIALRLSLGDVHHKTADAAIRRAHDQGLVLSQKIDGLSYYVLPPKGA